MTTNNEFETELSSLVWHWMPETEEDGVEHIHNIWPAITEALGPLPEVEALLDNDDADAAYDVLYPMISALPVDRVLRIIGDLDENNKLTVDYPDGLKGYLTDCFTDYPDDLIDHAAIDAIVRRIQGE